MKKMIVGNWKCHPSSIKEAEELFRVSDREGVVVCPPFVFMSVGRDMLKKAVLGAQDIFWEEGAFTGEISAPQVKDVGAFYVIVGHSERRAMGDTDDDVMKKAGAAVKAGLTAIVCVGEPAIVRAEGENDVKKFVTLQLSAIEPFITSGKIIIAYEPIWAIGTGNAATPDDAVSMISLIRSVAGDGVKVLYGGSVSSLNAEDFLSRPEIDGLLVGGASSDPAEFGRLLAAIGDRD
jgi:triosephosphate isomerase